MAGPSHRWLTHFINDFEHNPRFQFKFHLVMMVFWLVNLATGTTIMILAPHLWLVVGVYYVFVLSIYANWDTDYDAVSASLAAQHGEDLIKRSDAESAIDRLPGETPQ